MEERGETRCAKKLGHGLVWWQGASQTGAEGDEFRRPQQERERMDSGKQVISRKTRRAKNMILQGGLSGDFKEVCKRSIWNGQKAPGSPHCGFQVGLRLSVDRPHVLTHQVQGRKECTTLTIRTSGTLRKEAPLTRFVDEETDERSLA